MNCSDCKNVISQEDGYCHYCFSKRLEADESEFITTDYSADKLLHELAGIVDNGTTHVTVETPEGWKCDKPNCPTVFYHKHSTYDCLDPKP